MFRTLSVEEVETFRQWARENYELGTEIKSFWHPIVREECALLNIATGKSQDEY